MSQRKTYKAALTHARACMLQARNANNNYDTNTCADWLDNGLRNTVEARVLPVDMAQLRRLAEAFYTVGDGRFGPRDLPCHSIEEFLTYIKENAK